MGKLIDLTGKKFERLTVIDRSNITDCNNNAYWLCECICGDYIDVNSSNLRNGLTKSCGYLVKETSTKHGMRGSVEYTCWIR